MPERESPLEGQELAYVDFSAPEKDGPYLRPSSVTDIDDANLLTSKVKPSKPKNIKPDILFGDLFGENNHKVVIDLDLPAKLIPSTTPDHYHLIIDHEIPWDQYVRLLEVMAECGLVEPGYVRASIDRGYTAVRLPWVKKDTQKEGY